MKVQLFYIYSCSEAGFWSDTGDFVPDIDGATPYASEDRVETEIEDFGLLAEDHSIVIIPVLADVAILYPNSIKLIEVSENV